MPVDVHGARGRRANRHIIQLFDSSESCVEAVSAFVRDGLLAGETVLLLMNGADRAAVSGRVREAGLDLDAMIDSGRLTILDSTATLTRFMRRGRPDLDLFQRSVGSLVQDLTTRGAPLRIYGDMVDVLAAEADFDSALRLERIWDGMSARVPSTLLCGYSAVAFGDRRTAEALRAICGAHSDVWTHPGDVLGSFLLRVYGARTTQLPS